MNFIDSLTELRRSEREKCLSLVGGSIDLLIFFEKSW